MVDRAERQHGAISARQLVEIGVSRSTIGDWVRDGRLHRRHRGVYALGQPRLSDEGRLWAAVLATQATLDGRSSAWAWRILDPHPDPIHLADTTQHRKRAKLCIRHGPTLNAAVELRGLPATDLATTLATLPEALRRRAKANAAYQGLADHTDTENELELGLLDLLDGTGLPLPRTQVKLHGKLVDFLWPEHRLIVETDGRKAHLNPHAFEADRRRDAELLALGYRTVRITRKMIREDPAYVVATLRALLTTAGTLA